MIEVGFTYTEFDLPFYIIHLPILKDNKKGVTIRD